MQRHEEHSRWENDLVSLKSHHLAHVEGVPWVNRHWIPDTKVLVAAWHRILGVEVELVAGVALVAPEDSWSFAPARPASARFVC